MNEQGGRSLWTRMKSRWGVSSWGVVAILVAFSLAGVTVLKVARPIIELILPPEAPRWQWWTLRILVIVPAYEVLLLGYGTLLGQRRFFWGKQKELGRAIIRSFTGSGSV